MGSDLQERLDEAVASKQLAGVAAGVVHGGEVVAVAAAGDAGGGRPVTTRTPFLLASITKTFTAIAVMQHVEAGRLDLDEPVEHHLRSMALRPKDSSFPSVTSRHLLTHQAGIGELRSWRDLFRGTIGLAGQPGPEYYAEGLTVEVPPGSKWSYANHGFGTLGRLVEDLSGRTLRAYMDDRIFGPLAMVDTGFGGPRAGGYAVKRGALRSAPTVEVATAAAGGLVSTVEDMTRYLACLLSDGEPVLRPATMATMLERHVSPDPRLAGMGLAFMFEDLAGHRVAGHDGGWAGCSTTLAFAPADGWGVIVLTNTSTIGRQHRLALDVLADALGAKAERPVVHQSTALFGELAGSYLPDPGWNTNFRFLPLLEVEVVDRGDHLQAKPLVPLGRMAKDLRLEPVDADDPRRFEIELDGLRVAVAFTTDGRMVANRPFPALHKVTGIASRKGKLRAGGAVSAAMALRAATRQRR